VTDFANYLTSTPKAKGVDRIYYPGEVEYLKTQTFLKDGIEVEDNTWAELKKLAEEFGVAKQLDM
jgi:LDH2 family malate/lactate/ureidoglycolate dehydrogenase